VSASADTASLTCSLYSSAACSSSAMSTSIFISSPKRRTSESAARGLGARET
jgi:hypothetical protein